MNSQLLAVVLRTWAMLHAPPDATIAEAIATAVDEAPVFDKELLAATMAVYSAKESGNRMHPEAWSWGAKSGRSCSFLQLPCSLVRHMRAVDQARLWVRMVLHSSLAHVDSSPTRAAHRLSVALRALAEDAQ